MPDVISDRVRIHYEVEGNGPPLILEHGWFGTLDRWQELGYVAALKNEYRLILIDARGHGLSEKPHDAAAYSYQQMASDVLAVLDELGIVQAHYWGYSMGGAIGFRLGRVAPSRVLSLIIGGNHPFAMTSGEFAELEDMLRNLRQGMDAFVAGFEREHGPLPSQVRAAWLASDGVALAASQEGQMPDDKAGLPEPFDDLVMPILLYSGTADSVAAELPRAAEALPMATVVLLEGLDHGGAFRSSATVLPHVTEFLRQINHAD